MGTLNSKRMQDVSGFVQYELNFHVPLLVGRLIDEPLVVQEQFSNIKELIQLLDDHKLHMIQRAHAADDVSIFQISFAFGGPNAKGEVVVSEQDIKSEVAVDIDRSWVDDSVILWQQQLQSKMYEMTTMMNAWGA